MTEIIQVLAGLGFMAFGFLGAFGIVRFAPGYAKVGSLPVGIFFIVLGAKIAGWI
jgi:hypothetical protein